MQIPGLGDSYGSENDAMYLSTFETKDLYNFDKYEINKNANVSYWKNTTSGLANKFLNYYILFLDVNKIKKSLNFDN